MAQPSICTQLTAPLHLSACPQFPVPQLALLVDTSEPSHVLSWCLECPSLLDLARTSSSFQTEGVLLGLYLNQFYTSVDKSDLKATYQALFFFFFKLIIFGCVGSSLLRVGFL